MPEVLQRDEVDLGDWATDAPQEEHMPAKIFLDFGLGFEESTGPNGENGHYFDLGWMPDWVDEDSSRVFRGENPYNGETVYMPDTRALWGGYSYLNSLEDNLKVFNFDYNADGVVNLADANTMAEHVADAVRRSYEPFDVDVVVVESNSWDDMLETLASNEGHDSYVLVGGKRSGNGVLGISPLDADNATDDIVFAYAEDVFALVDDTGDMYDLVTALGKSAAHEAAHSFGLHHLLPSSAYNDLMYVGQGLVKLTNETFATRGILFPTEDGHLVDTYQYLADTLGLKPDAPAYVTGTGLHDQIELTETIWGDVNVQVDSYSDAHELVSTINYNVDASHGVLIEAGIGNDTIKIHGDFDVIARGGRGDDIIMTDGGNDVLEGEAGKDFLFAGLGNDTYRWGRGILDLGFDYIGDDGGDDTFDFSQFRGPISIDMSQGGYQVLGSQDTGKPQLRIFNYSANAIENIYGTAFADEITGTTGDDKIVGNGGGDLIHGNGGNDTIIYGRELFFADLILVEGKKKSTSKSDSDEQTKSERTSEQLLTKDDLSKI